MASLFNAAVKQSQLVKRDLETFSAAPEDAPANLPGQLSARLTSFGRAIDTYATSAQNELVPEKKTQALERVANFREELASAREELKVLRARREESVLSQNRQELFARRPAHQEATASENPYAAQGSVSRSEGLAHEGDVLSKASQHLDEFIEAGRAALGDVTDQNAMIRKTQHSMMKVASTLGISREAVRKVERRAKEDKGIFYGGITVMLILFWLIVRWFK